jgi:hypothetical protein
MTLKTGCEYHLRDDGIYQMIFYDFQHKTIDQYFRHLEVIYPGIPPQTRVKLLLDARPAQGFIPMLKYIIDTSREFEKAQPNRPPVALAMVMEMNIFTRVLDTTLRVFLRSRDRMRIFDIREFDAALDWLHEVVVSSEK